MKYPTLSIEVICKCSAHVNIETNKPEIEKPCWSCTRLIMVRLSTGGGYAVFNRDNFWQHWDLHEHRVPKERINFIYLEK